MNSEKEAQPVSLVGIGSSALQTSDPTESKGAPWVVSMGTSKLADQLGAKQRGGIHFENVSPVSRSTDIFQKQVCTDKKDGSCGNRAF